MNFGVRGNELGNHWMIWNFSQKNFSSNLICFEIQQTSIQIFLYINLFIDIVSLNCSTVNVTLG